ncbi:MAG: cytidylate kinase-like family protein [Desulfarculus sp.]|jgi:cytidylate kinase|nr:MAG: cytidylate kinase-like family protein [Desulfarculus sp.]
MAVVSISRQFGAGGKTLGEKVAQELGYRFLFETQLDTMAEEAMRAAGKEPEPSHYQSLVVDLLTNLAPSNFMDRWTGSSQWDEKQHIEALTRVIQGLADGGKVVLLGRGSQFILRHRPGTVRILLVAKMKDRIDFMVRNYGMEQQQAVRLINDADKKRARFLNNFYPGEPDEASLYHLALNTSLMPLQSATSQVCRLVQRLEG